LSTIVIFHAKLDLLEKNPHTVAGSAGDWRQADAAAAKA
jgi:hypothetical protein